MPYKTPDRKTLFLASAVIATLGIGTNNALGRTEPAPKAQGTEPASKVSGKDPFVLPAPVELPGEDQIDAAVKAAFEMQARAEREAAEKAARAEREAKAKAEAQAKAAEKAAKAKAQAAAAAKAAAARARAIKEAQAKSTAKAREAAKAKTGPSYVLTATAYNSLSAQTDRTPHITATGTRTRFGIVALSRDMLRKIPYGSVVRIEDLGTTGGRGAGKYNKLLSQQLFVVEDTMHARKVNQVDVWFPSRREALNWGRRNVRLTVVR